MFGQSFVYIVIYRWPTYTVHYDIFCSYLKQIEKNCFFIKTYLLTFHLTIPPFKDSGRSSKEQSFIMEKIKMGLVGVLQFENKTEQRLMSLTANILALSIILYM